MEQKIMLRWAGTLRRLQPGGWIIPPNPALHIHCGPPADEAISKALSAHRDNTIIIYVFPGMIQEEELISQRFSDYPLLIPLASWENSYAADRIAMAIELLYYNSSSFAVEPDMEKEFAAMFQLLPEKVLQAKSSRQNQRETGMSRPAAMIANLALAGMRRDMELLPGPYPFPAVVCGAGPSLANSMEALRKHRRGVFVIAVGHAFKTLSENGVRPDVIVEIDPNASNNWKHDLDPDEIPLVAGIGVDPAVAVRFRNIIWATGWERNEQKWFRQANVPILPLSGGRSVIIPALDLTRLIGFSAVALIGNDLCFSESGQAHAGEPEKPPEEERIPIPGCDDSTVYTNELFQTIKTALEYYLEQSDLPVCNCSAHGATIKGTTRLQFSEWLRLNAVSATSPVFFIKESRNRATEWLREKTVTFTDYAQKTQRLAEAHGTDETNILPTADETVAQLLAAEAQIPADLYYPISNLRRKTDEFMLAPSVPIIRPSLCPKDMWKNLRWRYRISSKLAMNIVNKLHAATEFATTQSSGDAFLNSIYEYNAFSWLAKIIVSRTHPALGEYLDTQEDNAHYADFTLTYKWNDIESVTWRKNGNNIVLDPPPSYSCAVVKEMSALLEKLSLQKNDGVIFVAPCGWQYVFELFRSHPEQPLLVLEPFPALLRQLVRHSPFLTKLPADATVIGIDHALFPEAETLLRQHLERWRQQGIRPRIMVHPRAEQIPEVTRAVARVTPFLT